MARQALLDVPRRPPWRGSRALVPLPRDRCPLCGEGLAHQTIQVDALFRHGGYGATRTTTTRWCPACGWRLVAQTQETRPSGR